MTPLSYEARTNYPNENDVDRIVSSVIVEAQQREKIHHPDDLLPKSYQAKAMAREIKRRLCQLISVEVDLVISGSTDEDDDTPAPVTFTNGARLEYFSTPKEKREPSNFSWRWPGDLPEPVINPYLKKVIDAMDHGYKSARDPLVPLFYPSCTGIKMLTSRQVVARCSAGAPPDALDAFLGPSPV